MNRKISCDMSHDNTMWLRKPELKVKKVFNRQIFRSWKLLVEVACGLSKKESHGINDKEDEREKYFWLKDRYSKLEHRYWLVVRLKEIEYKENFFCYLSSATSLVFRLVHLHRPFWMPTNPLRHFFCPPIVRSTYNRAYSCDDYLIKLSARVL